MTVPVDTVLRLTLYCHNAAWILNKDILIYLAKCHPCQFTHYFELCVSHRLATEAWLFFALSEIADRLTPCLHQTWLSTRHESYVGICHVAGSGQLFLRFAGHTDPQATLLAPTPPPPPWPLTPSRAAPTLCFYESDSTSSYPNQRVFTNPDTTVD